MSICIVCRERRAFPAKSISGVTYYLCDACGCIFADRTAIDNGDGGSRKYDDEYWSNEMSAARERCFGSSVVRVAETFLYARRDVRNFIDISCGSGLLLDAITTLNGTVGSRMVGVEPFPPPPAWRSSHPNYLIGYARDVQEKMDAGVCIEVIEHLWPDTLESLVSDLAAISNDKALYYFNSAQPSFVIANNYSYMSPFELGHVVSYSIKSVRDIFGRHGFTIIPLPGRDWAFLAEYNGEPNVGANELYNRVWTPTAENLTALQQGPFGHMLYTTAVEAARCYLESALRAGSA